MSGGVFINYTHPDQQAARSNRRKVLSYIGLNYRNRSRPTNRDPSTRFIQQCTGLEKHDSEQQQTERTRSSGDIRYVVPSSLLPSYVPHDRSGVREDPFFSYPVEYSSAVPSTVDYFISYYGPTHLIRPESISVGHGTLAVHQYFRYALQNETMFQAVITLAHASVAIKTWVNHRVDRMTLHYYGQTISLLRQELLNARDSLEDAVFFAIISLMGVDYLVNDLLAFQTHLIGMRQLIAVRGGLHTLGWPTVLKPSIICLESFWTYISHQPHLMRRITDSDQNPATVVETPANMISIQPALSIQSIIPLLPCGFAVLAEQRRLGIHLLEIVYHVVNDDHALDHGSPTSMIYQGSVRKFTNFATRDGHDITLAFNLSTSERLAKLIVDTNTTFLERVCCIGMFFVLLGAARAEQLSPIYFEQLQHHSLELLDLQLDKADPEVLEMMAWTIFNVASTLTPSSAFQPLENYQNDLRFALLAKAVAHFSRTRSWRDMEQMLRKFIWTKACVHAWENVWTLGISHLNRKD